jgi:hypothetical protein
VRTDQAPPLIVPSGKCDAAWLSQLLGPCWFGGDVALLYDPKTRDMRPVRVNWLGLSDGWEVN